MPRLPDRGPSARNRSGPECHRGPPDLRAARRSAAFAALLRSGLAAAALLATAGGAFAETITVNSTEDRPDADPQDGVCDADLTREGLQCTLRAAVQHANATPGIDEIVVPAGTYRLRLKGAGEDAAATGDIDVLEAVTIRGAAAATTIVDAKRIKDRAFDVDHAAGPVRFEDLTVRSGAAPNSESGGGFRVRRGTFELVRCVVTKCSSKDDAGGIDVRAGTAFLTDSWIVKNKAGDDGAGLDTDDGSVFASGCTFSANKARDEGGGLENSGTDVTLTNCTFAANRAKSAAGISLEDGGTLNLAFCTFAGNKARRGAAVDASDDQFGENTARVRACLFAKNGKSTCAGNLQSLGGNVDDGTSCGLTLAEDRSGEKSKLGKLRNNGGATPTVEVIQGAGFGLVEGTNPGTDQRGVARPTPCDAGAFQRRTM